MKKRQFYNTIILTTIVHFTVTAQTYFKIDPVLIGFGFIGGNIERVVSPKSSVQFQVYYLLESQQFNRAKGFGYRISARFFFSKSNAPKGFYFSPIIGSVPAEYNSSAFNMGLLIGYQTVFSDNRFTFEVGAGPLFRSASRGTGLDTAPQGVITVGYRLFRGEFND